MQDVHCQVLSHRWGRGGDAGCHRRSRRGSHYAPGVQTDTQAMSGNSVIARSGHSGIPLAPQISTIARSSLWPILCMLDHM